MKVGKSMIKSMTGYGRSECEKEGRKIILEMSTVNHRYCDINIRMPRTLAAFEEPIRKTLKQVIARGKVDVNLHYMSTAKEDVEVIANEAVCEAYLQTLRGLGDKFGLQDNLTLSDLLGLSDVMTLQKKSADEAEIHPLIDQVLAEALAQLISMRKQEGEALKVDLLQKIVGIEKIVEQLEILSPEIAKGYRVRLEERLEKLLGDVPVDESRLAVEVALFADKSCIDEEITRLKSHLVQLRDNLQQGEPVGRKLDFLMQEMNREANTIASKANYYEVTNYAVTLKTEIEKIREQIQNIE